MRKAILILTLLLAPLVAHAQRRLTPCNVVSAASNNATSCTAKTTQFWGIRFANTTATVYYLRLYNLATAPTCTSATGFIESIPLVPTGQTGQTIFFFPYPIAYSAGLGFCITAGSAGTDNTNAAVGILGDLFYSLQ